MSPSHRFPRLRGLAVIAFAIALGLLAVLPAGAATWTWANPAGGTWSTPSNWSPAGVPATGDDVVLPALGADYAVTLDVGASISGLAVGAGATLQMASTGALHYTGLAIQNDGVVIVGPVAANVLTFDDTSDTLRISGSGAIEMQGAGSVTSPLSRPTLHWRIVNGAGHTLRGDGNVWVPVENRGRIEQTGTGVKLLTLEQYLWNSGVVDVRDGGRVNVRFFVQSNGGTLVGHNGRVTVMPTDQPGDYNYGPIDNLHGGTLVADGGDLDLVAGVVAGGTVLRNGGAGIVGFHDVGNPQDVVVTSGAEALFDGGTGYHSTLATFENHGTVHVKGTLWVGTAVGDTVSTTSDGTIVLEGGTLAAAKNMAGVPQWILNTGTITGCGTIEGNFINAGTVNVDCPTGYENVTSPTFVNRGTVTVSRGYLHAWGAGATLTNVGVLSGGNGGILVDQGATIRNTGGVLVAGRSNVTLGRGATTASIVGGTLASTGGGYFMNAGQATLRDVTLDATATLYTLGHATTTAAGASVVIRGVNDVEAGGTFAAGATTDYVQAGGVTRLAGGTLVVPRGLTVDGALRGTGTVVGDVTNAGEVAPSASTAGLQVQGDYAQRRDGVLRFAIGGYASDQYGRLGVSGAAALDGRLAVETAGGFAPDGGRTFGVLSSGTRSGTFAAVDAAAGIVVDALYDEAGVALQTTVPLAVGGPSGPATLRFDARGAGLALELPRAADVTVSAYDVGGRRVAVLASGPRAAGTYAFDLRATGLPGGVYFARARVRGDGRTEVREARAILLR